ncbi:hypothetical protein [Sporosarcina luteola]|uniref:hypothetical protein n=1 Tax=Sporosarcina luteola TaxID=582850 RepID=UPI00203E0B74|nr:hypothetical protein [Sporosarcina luteola]MCM3711106.1 hypothetical protein [Sporosarcina luteola]
MKKGFLILFIPSILVGMIIFLAENTIAETQSPPKATEMNITLPELKIKEVFSYKTDFEALANLLNTTEKQYFALRKERSMLEIAELQGISEQELFNHLASENFNALKRAYDTDEVSLEFIMDYVLHLKEDLNWEMRIKKSK